MDAPDLAQLAAAGDFDALGLVQGLLHGETRFHAVLLAPLPPTMRDSIAAFLRDGGGPLATLPQHFKAQGAPDPVAAARHVVSQAQGLVVVVLGQDQGLSTIPQLFHGNLEPATIEQLVATCGPSFAHAAAVRQALHEVAERLGKQPFPHLVAGPAVDHDDLRATWLELAAGSVQASEALSVPGRSRERLVDLAWIIAQALGQLGGQLSVDEVELVVRVQLLAGEAAAAGQGIDVLIQAGVLADDELIELLHALVDGALAVGQAAQAAEWIEHHIAAWEAHIGPSYDVALAAVRLHAGAGSAGIVDAARRLQARNRKLARQDLTREPIWQVVADPGELLDTSQAADVLAKSATAIAKRLEARTIPWCVIDGKVRLPRQAVLQWRDALQACACWE